MDLIPFITASAFQSTFPRGERPKQNSNVMEHTRFNPRSHEGNDAVRLSGSVTSSKFQSTFPRGERQQSPTIFTYRSCRFLCNYTNICFSRQVISLITTLFSSIFHSYYSANLSGSICLLMIRTYTASSFLTV